MDEFKSEFKIICIKDCYDIYLPETEKNKVKKGQIFTTTIYDFNYLSGQIRLISNGEILGHFDNSDFMILDEYRSNTIEDIIDYGTKNDHN